MAVTVRVFEVVTGGGVHGGERDSEDEWKERKKEKKKDEDENTENERKEIE